MMNIIYTVCNRESLANTLALAESVSQFQPNDTFILGWVDTNLPTNLPAYIKAIDVKELNIPSFESRCATYFQYELLPATRPWFAKHILKEYPTCQTITFLAPSVILFASISDTEQVMGDFMVTPQITKPLPPSTTLNDARILNTGMFHAGSWILKPSEPVTEFIDWWCVRTLDRAFLDLCHGMCMDQLWLNYIPVRIKSWGKLQNPGWHYGLNKIALYQLNSTKNGLFVEQHPLISVDFAGITFFDPLWSDYKKEGSSRPEFTQLIKSYRIKLKSLENRSVSGIPAYGKYIKINKHRSFRNNVAQKLNSITKLIDNY